MEFENKDYGGIAKAGLTTGIIGTSLAALGGGLGNILGGWSNNNCGGGENTPVNRYEMGMQTQIINRDAEIAYLKSRDQAKSDSLELYKYVDGRFRTIEGQIAAQAVVNAQIGANLSCLQTSVAALQGLTKTVIPITNVCPTPAVATTTAG